MLSEIIAVVPLEIPIILKQCFLKKIIFYPAISSGVLPGGLFEIIITSQIIYAKKFHTPPNQAATKIIFRQK
jgi:hypothetical protein